MCEATGRADDFVIRAWDALKTEWPLYKANRQDCKLGPGFAVAGIVFFAKEWVNMEKIGEHGVSCRIEETELHAGPIRTAVRMERAARYLFAPRKLGVARGGASKKVASRKDLKPRSVSVKSCPRTP